MSSLVPPPNTRGDGLPHIWKQWFHEVWKVLRNVIISDTGTTVTFPPWVEIGNTDISGSPTEFQFTWDESLYSDIMVVISGIQCADDTISLGLQLGEADGATIHSTSGDYDGLRLAWSVGTISKFANTARIILLGSTGNQADEVINGTIHIRGTHGTNVGGFVHAQLLYQDSASNHDVQETRGFLDDGAAAGAIDTYRLSFNGAGTDRNWANVGNITTYGLKR